MKSVPLNPDGPPQGADARPSSAPRFDDIYNDHFSFVWRCLRGLGVEPEALADAAQDVFLVVHRQLAGFRGESSPRTWLYGIARHIASNHQRRVRRKQAALDPLVAEPEHPGPGPLERAEDAQAASFVEGFVAGLDARKRDVFILAVMEEMTIPEVAAALAIPVNTAYTRLRAVRAGLEQALRRHQP